MSGTAIGKYAASVGGSKVYASPEIAPEYLSLSEKYTVFPGFCDAHVHFREPGFSYKETIATGSRAAAHGGYTAVCTMPNLDPVPDCKEHLEAQLAIIRRDAAVDVRPFGAISVGEKGTELADLAGMADNVVGFSDDGRGVQDGALMREAMTEAKRLGKVVSAHCEVNSLLDGGYIHKGVYAEKHGHRGICSESEWKQIERDVAIAEETGAAYHVCHISCRESVSIIREAKSRGVNVTCETAPHYLLLDENDLLEDGRFKMNPPLRSADDRLALIEGVKDGTIDMIATDHAPHSREEKSRGLQGSAFGITGIELAFPLLYTGLVLPGVITLERLTELLVTAPRARFGIPLSGSDYSIWDLESGFTVQEDFFLSKGVSTPFLGRELMGKCLLTVFGGKPVYVDESVKL